MSDCPVDTCNRPRHNSLGVCNRHAWELRRDLAEVPALSDALDNFLARQTGRRADGTAKGSHHPLPYSEPVGEAIWVLKSALVGWTRDLEPDTAHQPADNLPALGRWLYARHHALVIHAAADQAVEEIGGATLNAWRSIDLRARTRVDLPDPCPDCGAELRAVIHDEGDPRPNRVWCLGEQAHRWEPHQWLRLGQRLGKGA